MPCSFEQHIRDYMVIEYAEFLLSRPEYWNIACNYLATAGDIGIGRMRAVLLHVGLRTPARRPIASNGDMDVDEAERDDRTRELDRVESVLRAAEEYGLEGATKEICRVSVNDIPRKIGSLMTIRSCHNVC